MASSNTKLNKEKMLLLLLLFNSVSKSSISIIYWWKVNSVWSGAWNACQESVLFSLQESGMPNLLVQLQPGASASRVDVVVTAEEE